MARTFVAASSQYLENGVAALTTGPNTNGITMACWFNMASSPATAILMALSNSASAAVGFELATRGVASVVRLGMSDGTTATSVDTTATWTTNTWNHAAAVWATTTDRTVYLNGGNAVNNTTARNSPPSLNRTNIGRRTNSSPGSYMDGSIASAGLWNAALTAKEIAALGQGVSPLYVRPGNLVGYWPLWGVHSPEIDLVGTPHVLTVTGATLGNHAPVVPYNAHRWGTDGEEIAAAAAGHPAMRRFGLAPYCRPVEVGRESVRIF